MNCKVSIIIPVYNAEVTIEKCLKSIINQSYKNIEIIVVNDGSTDKTENLILKYCEEDRRIMLINQNNSGVSNARNNGIKLATGDFILFVDSDDWLDNNMIEKMIEIAQREKTDVVRCNFFDEKIKKICVPDMYNLKNRRIVSKDYESELVREHFLLAKEPIKNLVMLLLIKKEFLINNMIYFDENLYMMEDVVFYQKIINSSKSIYFMNEPLYHYMENSNSVTNNPEKYLKMISGIIITNKFLIEYMKKNNTLKNNEKLINANHMRIIIIYIYYIFSNKGKKEFKRVMCDLYKNVDFTRILYNSDLSQISKQFKLFFFCIKKKNFFLTQILFKLKKYKER